MVRIYLMKIENPAKEGRGKLSMAGSHARQSAAAHRLLMRALAREYPEFAGGFRLEKDGRGKPFLAGRPEIHVSLSHSGRLAACAVGCRPAGIDTEQRKERARWERIARKLHEEERSWLERQPEEDRQQAFYDLWVRKESFLKATGEGLRLALDTFCTVGKGMDMRGLYSEAAQLVRQDVRAEAYYIRQYALEDKEYSLAVCSEEMEFAERPVWLPSEAEF